MHTHKNTQGFTLIELVIVIIILGILSTLVAMTYGGVRSKNRNNDRQIAINTIQAALEKYYAQNGSSSYPSLEQLNNPVWRTQNMPDLATKTMRDPEWSAKATACASAGQPAFVARPAARCYAYQVTSPTGSNCNNASVPCAHYTLTATLEGNQTYAMGSLN